MNQQIEADDDLFLPLFEATITSTFFDATTKTAVLVFLQRDREEVENGSYHFMGVTEFCYRSETADTMSTAEASDIGVRRREDGTIHIEIEIWSPGNVLSVTARSVTINRTRGDGR